MRRQGWLVVGVLALAAGAAAPAVAAPDLDVHVVGDAEDPLLDELDDVVDVDQATVAEADVVVVDGDEVTAGRILRSRKVRAALDRGTWVLLLDPSHGDRNALADLAGLDAERHDVAATMVRIRQDRRGDQVVHIREWPATLTQVTPPSPPPPPPTPDHDDDDPPPMEPLREPGDDDDIDVLRELTAKAIAQVLTRGAGTGRRDADSEKDDDRRGRSARAASATDVRSLPPEVQHMRVIHTWDDHVNVHRGSCQQTVTIHLSTTYDVFLQNSISRPFGERQWIAAGVDGWTTPKLSSQPWCAVQTADVTNVSGRTTSELVTGWWIAALDTSLAPRTDGIALRQALPETANASTEYTSGTSFKLGFSARARTSLLAEAAQADGGTSHDGSSVPIDGSVDAEWSVSSSAKYTVSNWSVRSLTSGNSAAWRFYARDPCDTESPSDLTTVNGCFAVSGELVNSGLPAQPNELSKGQMPFHTSGLWYTDEVRNDTVAFRPAAQTDLLEASCLGFFGAVCTRRFANRTTHAWSMPALGLDLGAVVPVRIASLAFDPGDDVTAGTKVTAIVALERPAPTDLSLPVTSDIRNVTVPARVDIRAGDTTGTFTILTRDNALKPGDHETGVISVFYAKGFSEQLTVRRP